MNNMSTVRAALKKTSFVVVLDSEQLQGSRVQNLDVLSRQSLGSYALRRLTAYRSYSYYAN